MDQALNKRIFLVRHGEVEAPAGVFLGKTDVGLSAQGRNHGEWLAQRLGRLAFDRCLCSPLLRARQTADFIAVGRDLHIETESALREIDFGHWEGRTYDDIVAEDAVMAGRWCEQQQGFVFPGGDAVSDFNARVEDLLRRLRQMDGENLLLVCHGGVIRTLLMLMLKLDLDNQFRFEVRRGSLSIVDLYEDEAILTRLNDHGDE